MPSVSLQGLHLGLIRELLFVHDGDFPVGEATELVALHDVALKERAAAIFHRLASLPVDVGGQPRALVSNPLRGRLLVGGRIRVHSEINRAEGHAVHDANVLWQTIA